MITWLAGGTFIVLALIATICGYKVQRRVWSPWVSTLRFPGPQTYWGPLVGPYFPPFAPMPREQWRDSQVVLVTVNGQNLELDCLVPGTDPAGRRGSTTSVPVTLHARRLAGHDSDRDLQRTIGAWIANATFVSISLEKTGGSDLVRINGTDSVVTLGLVRASYSDGSRA